jgi:hypothetical protein
MPTRLHVSLRAPTAPILNLKHGINRIDLHMGESEFNASAGAMYAFAACFIAFPCFCPREILLLVAVFISCPRRFLMDATQQWLMAGHRSISEGED